MELQVILMLVLSLMLVVMSAWTLVTFIRLEQASKTYRNSATFTSACKVTKPHVVTGSWVSGIVLVLSLGILALTSYQVYRKTA